MADFQLKDNIGLDLQRSL